VTEGSSSIWDVLADARVAHICKERWHYAGKQEKHKAEKAKQANLKKDIKRLNRTYSSNVKQNKGAPQTLEALDEQLTMLTEGEAELNASLAELKQEFEKQQAELERQMAKEAEKQAEEYRRQQKNMEDKLEAEREKARKKEEEIRELFRLVFSRKNSSLYCGSIGYCSSGLIVLQGSFPLKKSERRD